MAGQSLRPSQFITTYGPGAILEGPSGPRIVNSLATSGIFQNKKPRDIEIVDQRLSQSLLQGAGIVRLPTNAELGLTESETVYETKAFPAWSLCVRHGKLYRLLWSQLTGCPDCGPASNKFEAWNKARREAIRFVTACPEGHLDDVNWEGLVKHKKKKCRPGALIWEGGGGSLKNVTIKCPDCGGDFNLGQAYAMDLGCQGRFPELGTDRPGCTAYAKMMQRGAANLRLAELITSLTIPKRDTRLHLLLGQDVIKPALLGLQATGVAVTKQVIINVLQNLVNNNSLSSQIKDEVAVYGEPALIEAYKDVCESVPPQDEHEYRVEEYEALQKAASKGAPLTPASTPGGPPLFEVIKNDVKVFVGPGGHKIRVTPISRLRVVMVQTGYKRIDFTGNTVEVKINDGFKDWYPGVEMFGEGIFLDFAPASNGVYPGHFPLTGDEARNWMDGYNTPDQYGLDTDIIKEEYVHPVFVWWHTLSHRLINALSIDSGYSSASIRERVFVSIDETNSANTRGGLLLYTIQPGGDGTLGGLIAMVPDFDRVLKVALDSINTCSNDPLCGEEKFSPGRFNGAACYACELVSETSCEHRNMFLDRNLLVRNLP